MTFPSVRVIVRGNGKQRAKKPRTTTMNYRELQRTLKTLRLEGLTTIKLNQKTAILQAEYDRIQTQIAPQAQQTATDLPEITFGVEIEVTRVVSRDAIALALQAAGVAAAVEGYNHVTKRHWKVIEDGSCGYEVVSPILSGEKGITELRKVCEALTQAGCKVNKQCGLHVHLGADFLGVDRVRDFIKRYRANERNLDAIQPKTRRDSTNRFCRSIADTWRLDSRYLNGDSHSLNRCTTIEEMANLQWERYSKVNLQSYRKYNTIEIRHHAGTTDVNKITNWVRFLIGFATTATPETAANTDFNAMFSNNNIATFYRQRRTALAR